MNQAQLCDVCLRHPAKRQNILFHPTHINHFCRDCGPAWIKYCEFFMRTIAAPNGKTSTRVKELTFEFNGMDAEVAEDLSEVNLKGLAKAMENEPGRNKLILQPEPEPGLTEYILFCGVDDPLGRFMRYRVIGKNEAAKWVWHWTQEPLIDIRHLTQTALFKALHNMNNVLTQ